MGTVTKRLDVVAGRKYQTRNGEEKTHWINVGEGAEWSDGGTSLRLHAVPCGSWWDGTRTGRSEPRLSARLIVVRRRETTFPKTKSRSERWS